MGILNVLFGGGSKNSDIRQFTKELDQRERDFKKRESYEKEMRPVFNQYSTCLDYINHNWSKLYHSKNYNSKLSKNIEKKCWEAINYYEDLQIIDMKHGEEGLRGSKAFMKLALLYERRGDFESGIEVCKKAIYLNVDESGRMKSLIKKAKRDPTEEELRIINDITAQSDYK